MASNGRVTVTAEDIAGSDDTLKGALSMWVLKYGPVDYNRFQSAGGEAGSKAGGNAGGNCNFKVGQGFRNSFLTEVRTP